jgi:prepilin-type N-terminal cleavage/methylation domain-containing protein
MKGLRFREGFTLIELMIVVAIIGILAAVAIPKFAEMLRKSKEGSTKGSLTNLRSALTIYISDNEGYVPCQHGAGLTRLHAGFVPKYIEDFPTAKLGTYHNDTSAVARISVHSDRSVDMASAASPDVNGWVYTSVDGGAWWVACSHTDTKNANITVW